MSKGNLTSYLTLTGGLALGALTMYFLDPARGTSRRRWCKDKLSSATENVKDAFESKSHDLKNKARGALAEAKTAVTNVTKKKDASHESTAAKSESLTNEGQTARA